MMPLVSMIVTCKGRLSYLKESLPSMLDQNYYGHFEIVVVDYMCPDGTEDWVKSLDNPQVRCVKVWNNADMFNMSRARNVGACTSTNDIFAFVDSHNILARTYLNTVVRAYQSYDLVFPDERMGSTTIPRELFHKLRGYDESLEVYGWDDVDLYDRAKAQGYQVNILPKKLIHVLDHTEEEQLRYYPLKDRWASIEINKQKCADKFRIVNPDGYGKI